MSLADRRHTRWADKSRLTIPRSVVSPIFQLCLQLAVISTNDSKFFAHFYFKCFVYFINDIKNFESIRYKRRVETPENGVSGTSANLLVSPR